ncbi:hypothetical protein ABFV05_018718 [Capra hircus]
MPLIVSQMISFWGYPSEMHKVITADGYILQVYRIPHGKNDANHLGRTGFCSVTNLGFLLANAGYDMCFDEMAEYDLPSTIDFILRRTGQEKLHYVGHSQGTTIGFVAFSTNPTLAEKIEVFHALAPVATVKHTQSLFNKLALIPHFLFKVCVEVCSHEALDVLCKNALFAITGVDYKNLNMSRLDVYIAHNPAGTSAVKSGKFQAFDWGASVQNLVHHHQVSVLTMNVPIAIWNGGKDLLADPQDVDLLLSKLPNLIYHKEIPNYNHLDLIWAVDAPQEVYNEIVSLVAEEKKQF